MARFYSTHMPSWRIVLGAVVLAAAAWGYYTWRFASGPARRSLDDEARVAETETSPLPDAETGGRLATLRAMRTSANAEAGTGALSSGAVGRPASDSRHAPAGLAQGSPPGQDRRLLSRWPAAELSASVTANAAPASQGEIEITLGQKGPPLPGSAASGIQTALAALASGKLLDARAVLSAALHQGLPQAERALARSELARIADALLFSRATNTGDPLTRVHVVRSGDSLHTIARRYKVTEELLASINQIENPHRIYAGTRLKVIHGPFDAVIYKSDHRMDIYLGDVLVRSFRVGLGTNGGTPLGTWIVRNKLKNPDWTDPKTHRHYLADDPDNPIGEYWIGLHGIAGEAVGRVGFGIHGTIDPTSIGENMSMGCIRLVPQEIAMVYRLLTPEHSRVVIRP